MSTLPQPIFSKNISHISWKKIYEREYGVQYSEVALLLLATARYHFPKTSVAQVIVPGQGHNTAFYIDDSAWKHLVEALNKKYTTNSTSLKAYEKQFLADGKKYLTIAKKIARTNLKKGSNKKLLAIFLEYQEQWLHYTVFVWTAFILNNYVAERASSIVESYIKQHGKESQREGIIEALFRPTKRTALLELQYKVERHQGELNQQQLNALYKEFKWLACLDIHNAAWTKEQFTEHIKSFTPTPRKNIMPWKNILKILHPTLRDQEYLRMAQRFVYLKDARDDMRRQSVCYARNLYQELAQRMGIPAEDISYVQEQEIIDFLNEDTQVVPRIIAERKKGFILYLDHKKHIICLHGEQVPQALTMLNLVPQATQEQTIKGVCASKGIAEGAVVIVQGVKNLSKVQQGSILVAVSTHPDYVLAMRKAAAIVTDEGGITSHAGIVAREFGIPCIVGTTNATKVFHDGDTVQVDAIKGTVKKLKARV